MSQKARIVVALVILVIIAGVVLGADALSRLRAAAAPEAIPPGAIPVYLDGHLAGSVTSADLAPVAEVSFADAAEGVEQRGWLLRDVVLLRVDRDFLPPGAMLRVSSSSRNKAVELTWAEADDSTNHVMFDLSNRGTLKLVSTMARLDTREEWVQDADRIDVRTR